MDQNALSNRLIEIAAHATQVRSEKFTRRQIGLGAERGIYYLVDDDADTYSDLCRHLLDKSEWKAKFSEKYVSDAVHSILAQIWDGGSSVNVPLLVDDLFHTLDSYNEEQIVYVSLVGLAMGVESVDLGKITMRLMTDRQVDEMIRESATKLQESTLDPAGQELALQRRREALFEPMRGSIVAEYRVVAESTRAQERAEDEVHRVLDLLRYAMPHLFKKGVRMAVGIVGELGIVERKTQIVSPATGGYHVHSEIAGPIDPFIVSPVTLGLMAEIGVFEVAKILGKPGGVTDYEETLLRGIHWYANALTQNELENKVLSLVTCLETFLASMPGEQVSESLAEGVAVALFQSPEERKRKKKRIKELYRLRSTVSHGGSKTILNVDLDELTEIAGRFTAYMIGRLDDFRSRGRRAFPDWWEEQRLKVEL
jgi:hypothetical protein